MSTTGWAVTIVAIIIILMGGWWLAAQAPGMPAATDTTAVVNSDAGTDAGADAGASAASTTDADAGASASGQATGPTIRYTADGFSPKDVTIQAGQKVTFVNDTQGNMWVASDEHPTHTEFDGTDRATHCSGTYAGPTPFDQCQPGSSYTFVFAKAGTYAFHNHSAAQYEGTVTVK
jgi:plastocyanin